MATETQVLRHAVTLKTLHGLHLGPSSVVAQLARKFQCSIMLSKAGKKADAKSVWDMLALVAGSGDELELEISGQDAPDAMKQFLQLFDRDFFPSAAGGPNATPSPA